MIVLRFINQQLCSAKWFTIWVIASVPDECFGKQGSAMVECWTLTGAGVRTLLQTRPWVITGLAVLSKLGQLCSPTLPVCFRRDVQGVGWFLPSGFYARGSKDLMQRN